MSRLGRTTVLINSAYRNNPNATSTTDFVYTFPSRIDNVVHCNLLSAVVENGVYNVDSTNDQFNIVFDPAGTPITHSISIPSGYYDDSTWITEISNALNAINTLVTGTGTQSTFFVDVTNQGFLTISNDLSSNWQINFPEVGTAQLMGFDPTQTYAPSATPNGPYVIKGVKKVKLTNFDMLLLSSDRMGNEITTNQSFGSFWSILNGNQLTNSTTITYINYRNPTLEVLMSARDLEWVDVRLTDIYGRVVDIGTNNIQLLVEFYTDDSKSR